jgi:hypothetical protein
MTEYRELSSQLAVRPQVAFAEALRQCEGKFVGFWRTGTRTTELLELAGKPE